MRITISYGATPAKKKVEQDHQPTGTGSFYVYVHRDCNGKIFYVGKGTEKRAWSEDRHPLWHKYVAEKSGGKYTVQIVSYHQTSEEAEEAEEAHISLYGEQIVNWINPGRKFDYEVLERYHKARNTNRAFIAETRSMETATPDVCVDRYRQAMEKMYEYESLTWETGLIAELSGDDQELRGDVGLVDRLTLCLFRLARYTEVNDAVNAFLLRFPKTVGRTDMQRILKRRDRGNKLAPRCA
jgi:hypothetical protein